MDNLLLNDHTRLAVTAALTGNAHTILLIGPVGSGKDTLASHILAAKINNIALQNLHSDSASTLWLGVETVVGIDEIRQAQQFLSLKTVGAGDIKRGIVIKQADKMRDEAQNAMLKMLEEPPNDTIIILCATNKLHLRSTILSRAQLIEIKPVSVQSATLYFSDYAADTVTKTATLAGGNVGLMKSLLDGDNDHPLVASIERAKEILTSSTLERLTQVDELSKDKTATDEIVRAIRKTARAALFAATEKEDQDNVRKWHKRYNEASEAAELLDRNPNYKLLLTQLFLNL